MRRLEWRRPDLRPAAVIGLTRSEVARRSVGSQERYVRDNQEYQYQRERSAQRSREVSGSGDSQECQTLIGQRRYRNRQTA